MPGPFGSIIPNGPGAPLPRPLSRPLRVVQAGSMRKSDEAAAAQAPNPAERLVLPAGVRQVRGYHRGDDAPEQTPVTAVCSLPVIRATASMASSTACP
jgi:hypothetical protein